MTKFFGKNAAARSSRSIPFRLLLVLCVVLVSSVATVVVAPAAHAAAITSASFLKASGNVLKTNSGTGVTTNLRGTNLGGWFTQEAWMSPLGDFAADRTGWVATASAGTASNALDGSQTTRWSTGANQAGSEWLRVDLGAATYFDRMSIDNTNNPGQYPRAINVETSTNGTTWASVANLPGVDGVTTARFALQVARYLRVSQTGTATVPWSVGELNLYNDPVVRSAGETAWASVSGAGTPASAAVDGNISTTWQSGAPQSPGQTFTVDLGHAINMDKFLFDAGAATSNDYPRMWDIYLSTDNSNWSHASGGFGTNRVIQADFQGSKYARYIQIVSSGSSPQWWSIAEIAVSSLDGIDRSGWNVSSSVGSSPSNVLDGNLATRWTTGTAQTNGQYVQVDLGALTTLNNVATENAKSSSDEGDWPRGYRLDLSKNGTTWTTVASGVGTFKATNISFVAQAARYFRITQTSTAPQWWTIGELTAGLHDDEYDLRATLTSRFGVAGAESILQTHQNTWIQASDLDNIQAAGLNMVRVPVGWDTFLNADGTSKSNAFTKLDWLVTQASARGIYVLLDLHTEPGGACSWDSCGRSGPQPNSFWGTSTYQNWYVTIWQSIASHFVGNAGIAGYDIINEPLIDGSEDADDFWQKNDLFDRAYDAIRAIDPDHVIVIPAFLSMSSVASPATYGWTNVMYEKHPYDMSSPRDWTAQNNLVSNELSALPSELSNPGVPLLMGEYSLYYNDDLWAKWMAGLNASNVSWSNWTYKVRGTADGGFAYWGMYSGNQSPVPIINSDDAATFTSKLSQFGTSNFTKNTRFVETVKKYSGGLASYAPVEVNHAGWSATASATASYTSPSAGIDGATGSAWTNGAPMSGGEWFKVDMGSNQTVAMVILETSAAAGEDYPRSFKVELSTNGTSWTTAATGVGYGWKRPISVVPTVARYIRITQTGASTQWWTIDQTTVYSSY